MDHYAHDVDVQPDSVDFPNTIMRRRTSTTQQDDTPDFSTKTGDEPDAPPTAMTGTESAAGDVDSCRICRGEGTPGEPLFYPCKCSGSIKYVHQDCLMEWLSHSQKKHCELCKTPFRFTKLYSPNMPQRLPFYVFSTHMAKYLVSNILVWLRGALVMSVWLGWLPYLMRSVWSFLFWISDEGFGPSHSFSSADAPSAAAHLSLVAFTMATQGLTSDTCPAGPLFPATTTAASKSDIAQQMPNLLRTAALPLHLNTSGVNSFTASLARLVFGGDALSVQRTWGESSNETNLLWSSPQHETLLSEVAFLKDLSPHPVINRIVIRIFEGQIITILVIICFILIILVRDYVVQQQPEINMRAAFAAQMDNVEQVQELPQAQLLPEGPIQANAALGDEHHSDGESARAIESMVAHDGEATDYLQATDRQGDVAVEEFRQRPIAEFRRRLTRRDAQEDAVSAPPTGSSSNAYGPLRGQLNSNVREHLLEALDEQSQSTVNQYLRVYRQANGDRERILQIIRDEGLEERLAYWVNATEAMPNLGSGTASDSIAGPNTDKLGSHAQPTHRPRQSEADTAEANGHGHILTTDMTQKSVDQSPPMSLLKGKQKAVEKDMEHSLATPESVGHSYWHQPNMHGGNSDAPIPDNSAPPAAPTRPRAVSDGPLIRDRINPLANNSWSFAAMPESESITHPTLQIAAPAFDQKMSPREGSPGSNWSDPFEIQEFGSDERTPFTQPQQFHDTLHAVEAGATLDMQPDTDADTHLDREIREEIATGLGDGAREAAAIPQPATLADRVADFLWGDIEAGTDGTGADALELFIDDPHAPFMELGHDHDDSDDEANEEDEGVAINEALPGGLAPEVLEAAAAAGIDPDAIEDAEDFDGVMELLGMRGPLAGLFQNAIFCAFLVSITIFLGVFLPYNIGRLAVWIAANPMRIVHMVLSFSRFVQDSCLFAVGWTASSMFDFLYMIAKFSHIENARILLAGASADARQLTMESLNRIWDSIVYETTFITSNEIRNFSVVSHEALITVKQHTSQVLSISARTIVFLLGGNYASKWETAKSITAETAPYALELAKNFSSAITRPNSWMINLNIPESATTFDPSLAYWGAEDRTLAIFSGYVSMSLLAGLYLGRGTPFSSGSTAQEWEASVIDVLNQASGVMKVILIISIEMLVFPLYCGLLLDFALLPLFESTSFKSRLLFTYNYPLTSIFVHWFVGTGYMFHFALFVSMCRKIMRKGVLCKSSIHSILTHY